jgi:hypothetical protein
MRLSRSNASWRREMRKKEDNVIVAILIVMPYLLVVA